MRVLGPVAVDHLVAAVIPLEGEVDLEDVGAGLDDLQDTCTGKIIMNIVLGILPKKKARNEKDSTVTFNYKENIF